MAWTRRTELHHSLWALWGELNLLLNKQTKLNKTMHWSRELWLLKRLLSRSSMYSPLRFHWLRNKGVQVSVCFFTKYRVSEDSRAGNSLRLIISAERNKCRVWTSWKFNNHSDWRVFFNFGNDAFFFFHGSLRCSMIASKRQWGISL